MERSSAIIYVMGVSGCGKTTIGSELAKRMAVPFFDGDAFHPQANKEKMHAGIPLTDGDRWQWLDALHSLALTEQDKDGAVIACSALRAVYRAKLSDEIAHVQWIWLDGSFELIHQRMLARKGHFMSPELLCSQFATLEPPGDALRVDISQSPEAIVNEILTHLQPKN
ncbi:MAG TPA: gluconokinase [Chitinophagaceae bacterium]